MMEQPRKLLTLICFYRLCVIECLDRHMRAVARRRISPLQFILDEVDDPAIEPPVLHARNPM